MGPSSHTLPALRRRGRVGVPVDDDVGLGAEDLLVEGVKLGDPGGNCIKIGLPEKLILSKRKGLREVLFS